MIHRVVARVTQIPVVRFLQAVLALGVGVLLMTRNARPFGLMPGAIIAATILLPNLLSKRFRLSVWLGALFAAYAILFVTRLFPFTSYAMLGPCKIQPEAGPAASDPGYPEMFALLWFIAALATGVQMRFLHRGRSGKLDAGAWPVVVAAGLWLSAAGAVSRSDELLRIPHQAWCFCGEHTMSFAESVCPDIVTTCAAKEVGDTESADCTLVVSPIARAGAKLGWVLFGMGLSIAAGGAYASRWRSDGDAQEEKSAKPPGNLLKPSPIDSRVLVAAFLVIPFFLLGVYRATVALNLQTFRFVTMPVLEWLYKKAGIL